jgi:hypothetical protein
MNSKADLNESALAWLKDRAGLSLLGPFELQIDTNEEEVKTVFRIILSGTPVEFIDGENSILISPSINSNEAKAELSTIDDGRGLDLYFETIDQYFLGAYSYLQIDIDGNLYAKACFLANYANTRSSLAFFQVYKNDDSELIVKVKSFSSAFKGASDVDFYNVIYAVLKSSYQYWELFDLLNNINLSSDEIISIFENNNSRE